MSHYLSIWTIVGCNCCFPFWKIFCPFTSLTAQRMKTSKTKKKKTPGDIIILHNCFKIYDHRLYCSWDMAGDKCYFSFWAIFCPFTLLIAKKKSKFQKNERKNTWRYHHFTHVYQKLWLDNVRFLRYGVWQTDKQSGGQTDGQTIKGLVQINSNSIV